MIGSRITHHEYFKKRLEDLRMIDSNSNSNGIIGQCIENMSEAFRDAGHSGQSSIITIQLFNQLMKEWTDQDLR